MTLGVSDSYKVDPVSSAVRTLQWDLEYVYASSMTAVSITMSNKTYLTYIEIVWLYKFSLISSELL